MLALLGQSSEMINGNLLQFLRLQLITKILDIRASMLHDNDNDNDSSIATLNELFDQCIDYIDTIELREVPLTVPACLLLFGVCLSLISALRKHRFLGSTLKSLWHTSTSCRKSKSTTSSSRPNASGRYGW